MKVNPWLDRVVIGWAHQGGGLEAQPSTLVAMRRALENGAGGLELDVHLAKDGALVVHHDAVMDGDVDGDGLVIADTTLPALRYWRSDVLTLAEVLDELPGVPLVIEPKTYAAAAPTARAIRAAAERGPTIVAAFMPWVMWRVKRTAPELHTAGTALTNLVYVVLTRRWLPVLRFLPLPIGRRHVALQVELDFGHFSPRLRGVRGINPLLVAAAHRQGLAVHAWTLNGEDDMRAGLALGVDGIITDRPSVLTKVLRAERRHWRRDAALPPHVGVREKGG